MSLGLVTRLWGGTHFISANLFIRWLAKHTKYTFIVPLSQSIICSKEALSQHRFLSTNSPNIKAIWKVAVQIQDAKRKSGWSRLLQLVATDSRLGRIALKHHMHYNSRLHTANRYKQMNGLGTVCCHSFKRESLSEADYLCSKINVTRIYLLWDERTWNKSVRLKQELPFLQLLEKYNDWVQLHAGIKRREEEGYTNNSVVIDGSTGAWTITQLPLFIREKPGRDGLTH